jgi:NADH-quinone oxidoreductase subunit I
VIGILKSVGTALRTAARRPVTVQYPTEHREIPQRERAFPILLWDENIDEPFCTGCQACARACPCECMTVVMKDNPRFKAGESKRRKIVEKFWIDYGRCMKCNICVEVCNFEAIAMNNTWAGFELSRYDRRDLVMDVDDLLRQSKEGTIKEWVAP